MIDLYGDVDFQNYHHIAFYDVKSKKVLPNNFSEIVGNKIKYDGVIFKSPNKTTDINDNYLCQRLGRYGD